jgi:hypothetical protein
VLALVPQRAGLGDDVVVLRGRSSEDFVRSLKTP